MTAEPEQKKTKKWYSEWIVVFLIALVISVVVRMFFYAPYEVHGTSMYPSLEGNEMLIVNKWIYHFQTPSYGDVVVFHTDEQRDFIKRVIGLPGDKIMIKDGQVYRNGQVLHEPYIYEKTLGDYPELEIPEGHLFVMGDNRNNSKDSRQIGVVSLEQVVGRADVVILPLNQFHLVNP